MADKAKTKSPREAGLARRARMFGPQGAAPALDAASAFKRPLEEYVTDVCFGGVWERGVIDDRTRSMLTIAVLTTLGRGPQLVNHVKGAIANGVTPEEIREVIMHTVVYAGLPMGVEATLVAEKTLAEMEAK
jgi:4-carboxymuconolactone decarboxylase